MRIKKMLSRNRRDFTALYECENCGYKEERSGYDDRNFHDNVISNIVCSECGKTRNDLGIVSFPTKTKYTENEIV